MKINRLNESKVRYQVLVDAVGRDNVVSEHEFLRDAIESAKYEASLSYASNIRIKDMSDGQCWHEIENAEADLNDGLVNEAVVHYPSDSYSRDNSDYNKMKADEEASHSYVGKKVKWKENNRTYTVTGAYDGRDGTTVRCNNITMKPDEYEIVNESMIIGYDEGSIKEQIRILNKNIEDYKQLIIDEPEDKEYWQEMINKCQAEIDELNSYEPLDEAKIFGAKAKQLNEDPEPVHLDLVRVDDEDDTPEEDAIQFNDEIAGELDAYFRENNLHVDEMFFNPTEGTIEFDINDGDWKHEHLRSKFLIQEFFEGMNTRVFINSFETMGSEGDWYSAHYELHPRKN